jgi:D-amino-acid dehydrogenase
MQSGKGYSMTLDEPRALPELCSILVEARIAVTPMGRALRIAGTMAVTGLDRSIDHKRVDGMIRSIPDYFPQIRAEVFRGKPVWSGLRPCPPDGVPYVGRFAKYPNLIAATGHAMMGVSLAPSTGEMISKLVSGDTLGESQRILSPDRV